MTGSTELWRFGAAQLENKHHLKGPVKSVRLYPKKYSKGLGDKLSVGEYYLKHLNGLGGSEKVLKSVTEPKGLRGKHFSKDELKGESFELGKSISDLKIFNYQLVSIKLKWDELFTYE